MEVEQAGTEPDFAARIEAVKALVPVMGATKSEQQSAIERTAVEITAVLDQMHAHDHELEVLRSLRQGLRRDIVMDIRLLRTEMGRSRNDISSLAEVVVEKGLRRRFPRTSWRHIPLETAHSSGDGAHLWRGGIPLETVHSS